jgi:LAS superfamily LD-carboxypeptidase LdcB
MNENEQDIDLNNDVVDEGVETIDDTASELEELRAYKAEQEELKRKADENRENAKRRVAQKQPTKTNLTSTDKDIQEIKFIHKVSTFAEENNLTKIQAERVLKLYPDATSETLKDPFIAEGLKAIARKERVEDSTPKTGRVSTIGGKSFSEMTPAEREKNFTKAYNLQ